MGSLLASACACVLLVYSHTDRAKSLSNWVVELGPPTFLAKRLTIRSTRLKVMGLEVFEIDPEAPTEWAGLSNTVAVWADSVRYRRDARLFYANDLKTNNSNIRLFGWQRLNSRSYFGEKMLVARVGDANEKVKLQRVVVDALDLTLVTPGTNKTSRQFVPRSDLHR